MASKLFSGTLNRRIELFYETKTKQATGERIKVFTSFGMRWSKREDANVNQDDAGKLITINETVFTVRYNPLIMEKAAVLIVRDFDGDYEVVAPKLASESFGRKKFIELKCSKRDAEISI